LVYGDGFRAAYESFQAHGLKAVVEHVLGTGQLPPTGNSLNLNNTIVRGLPQ
jgi:Protein DA1